MRLKNTRNNFGVVAILIHWIMAVIMIGLLILGLYMVQLPIGLQKLKLYGWHKEYGFIVLTLAVFRLSWRLYNVNPQLSIPLWEFIAARAMHWALYIFMFAMPVTGWLLTSAAGFPVSFFGLFTVPTLIAPNEESRHFFATVHEWLGYALIGAIILHASAALKHHFINKDDILRRMIS